MRPGAAFGLGDHPTTRLAIRAMAEALAGNVPESALDIGTGTGVLAIAAALLGARRVLAVDIDPCARAEAAANVAENELTARITVADTSIDRIQGDFSMVSANLRPPTLSRLADRIGALSGADAVAVLSGFRPAEWPPLKRDYRISGWSPFWGGIENGWMAVACRKRASGRA
jgi:ribosomal protein L11 methyltransferase